MTTATERDRILALMRDQASTYAKRSAKLHKEAAAHPSEAWRAEAARSVWWAAHALTFAMARIEATAPVLPDVDHDADATVAAMLSERRGGAGRVPLTLNRSDDGL